VESGALKRLVPTEAEALGMVRAGVCGFILCEILTTSFRDLGRIPATLLHPPGVMKFLPWRFYDWLLTPGVMTAFKWLFAASLLAATVGFLTRLSTKSSALLFLFYEGLLRSITHFNHDEMPAIYILCVLAFTPCGDGFSLDALRARRRASANARADIIYGYPILLMRVLLAWSYFSSALIKLRVVGLGYLSPDNLPALAIENSLDNLHATHFRAAFWLPQFRDYLPFALLSVLVWELSFPLAIWSRRARFLIPAAGVVFHLSTLVLMNIFFPYHLAMYLVFVDWPAVARKLERSESFIRARGAVSGFRRRAGQKEGGKNFF
jgi:hypothetical protein